jgi:hypothetical protein
MSGPRGLNLSGTQVIASVLATLTGAIAASYLGVAGTLIGAAVGSISSTMGTEIYKHYLQRSQDRLRTAGQVVLHHPDTTASSTAPGATVGGRRAAPAGSASRPAAEGGAERDTAVWDRRQYGAPRDPHETELIPGAATEWGGVADDWSPKSGTTNGGSSYGRIASGSAANGSAANGSAANGGGRPGGTASSHAHGQLTGEGPAGGDAAAGGLWGAVTSFFAGLTRRQWLTYGGIAAGFFVIVVTAIVVFQLAVGRSPLSSPLSRSARQQQTTHPSSTPSATPTGSTPASPTSSAATAPGTPTPSSTPSPGTSGPASSPSAVPSATPSTGSSGAARSTTTVTPTP